MATAPKQKRGLFSFYRSRFKPTPKPVVAETGSARPSISNPTTAPSIVAAARSSDYYGEEKIKALVTISKEEEKEKKKKVVVVEDARKSVSHVETSLASVVGFLQVTVLVTDMPGSMQIHAFRCARIAHDSLSSKFAAHLMKKEFDKTYGPAWHCIVGSSFGSFVTHSTGCFLYFSIDNLYVLLFKTKVRKALQ